MFTLFIFSSCQHNNKNISDQDFNIYNQDFAPVHLQFNLFARDLYFKLNATQINYQMFTTALKGYLALKENKTLKRDSILTLIDFTAPASQKRLFIIDVKNKHLLLETYVAHGQNSGLLYATDFSNAHGSNKSSIGFYIASEIYSGSNGLSLKLDGQEYVNNNARARGVVIHGASYVNEQMIKYSGRIGRSFGCPAVPDYLNERVIKLLQNKSCLFIYYPNAAYLKNSELVNANPAITNFQTIS